MKLNRIKLQGFIGLKKGMNVDTVDLDLSEMTGLVALEGDNGNGKTTLLENLQPFRTLPSRKQTLKSHCFLKNSFKELWFDFDGDHYHTLVKMDPTTTVSDEGYIWKNDEPQVNGKVSLFDKYLVDLLGTPSLFFNSIFCAQNSSKLSDLRPAELKALFAEFLRLDRYVNWENTSKSAVGIYQGAILDLQRVVTRLSEQHALMGNVLSNHQNAEKVLAYLETKQTETKVKTDNAHNLETKCREAVTTQAETRVLLEAATKDKHQMVVIADKAAQDYDGAIVDLQVKSTVLEDEARQVEIDLEDSEKVGAAAKIYENAEKALEELELRRDVLDIEVTGTKELHTNESDRLRVATEQLDSIGRDTTIKDATTEMAEVERSITFSLERIERVTESPELMVIKAELTAAEKSAAVLENIDPGCTSEICGLITKSLEDKKAIPGIKERHKAAWEKALRIFNEQIVKDRGKVAELTDKVESHVKERDTLLKEYGQTQAEILAVLKTLEADILEKGRQQGALIKDIEDWKKTKADARANKERLSAILVAEARKVQIIKELDAIVKQVDALEAKYKDVGMDFTKKIAVSQSEIFRLNDLIDPQVDSRLKIAEDEVRIARAEGTKVFEDIVKCQADIDKASQAIRDASKIKDEIKATEAVITRFRGQEGQWAYLAEACSKDGLRALEIEGVAPVITGYANDMLSGTFGPNHSVRFETQNEDGKEVLDIVVISEDGSETLLSNLSGGERVWILKALSLAQTLISQEKSGRHFETALMDEEDGALSNANAMRFIALYRTLMSMAKMGACIFISHRPDAIALADHRIKLENGGIKVI